MLSDDKLTTKFGGVMISLASNAFPRFSLPEPVSLNENSEPYASDTISEVVMRSDFISSFVMVGYFSNSSATEPLTCGAAKLVPLVKLYPPFV